MSISGDTPLPLVVLGLPLGLGHVFSLQGFQIRMLFTMP
jgi:hypothetical protein